mmetsp:Transcript_56344/g.150016  ORF Transcript_56344/g.150016 Transcript_56344/m.150016 type:complete len:264 (-) Transcript_56344:635-1426(-)
MGRQLRRRVPEGLVLLVGAGVQVPRHLVLLRLETLVEPMTFRWLPPRLEAVRQRLPRGGKPRVSRRRVHERRPLLGGGPAAAGLQGGGGARTAADGLVQAQAGNDVRGLCLRRWLRRRCKIPSTERRGGSRRPWGRLDVRADRPQLPALLRLVPILCRLFHRQRLNLHHVLAQPQPGRAQVIQQGLHLLPKSQPRDCPGNVGREVHALDGHRVFQKMPHGHPGELHLPRGLRQQDLDQWAGLLGELLVHSRHFCGALQGVLQQ